MKVIPAMDLLGGRVVRLRRGDYKNVTVYPIEPEAALERYARAGARRAHIVDLDGAREGRAVQSELIARLVERFKNTLEIQLGGGIRTGETVRAWHDAGVARVVIGTKAIDDIDFVKQSSGVLPVIAAVDARDGLVATHGWAHTTDREAVGVAVECVAHGATGVLYTDITRDGTGTGPNIEATERIAKSVRSAEVIASGGVATLDHLRALASRKVIAAVVVGRALYEGEFTIEEALGAVNGDTR